MTAVAEESRAAIEWLEDDAVYETTRRRAVYSHQGGPMVIRQMFQLIPGNPAHVRWESPHKAMHWIPGEELRRLPW